jgi:hypothetical protein
MQGKFRYIVEGKEVTRDEFFNIAGDWVTTVSGCDVSKEPFSDSFGGEKNKTAGLSTRHKAKTPMTYLDEVLGNQKDNIITNVSRGEVEVLDSFRGVKPLTPADAFIEMWKKSFDRKKPTEDIVKETEGKGVKLNELKPQMSLLFKQFPKALEAIVRCSEYGHSKYKETDEDYLNFKRVEGGSKTYADASLRHRMQQGNDEESGLPHAYHSAWNALSELELWIDENNSK